MKSIDKALSYVKDNKKTVAIVALFVLGAILLLLSASGGEKSAEKESGDSLTEYKALLEEELAQLCSSVEGVGRCTVTVSFERGEEKLYKGSNLIETKPPRVMGITVVCRGADSDSVRANLTAMLSSLFDIGTNRVSVLKLNS